jgi:glycosyltransferase involved in cell wall biosynthesis
MRVQFHLLSFEGPDGYARAGGIASRVTGLAQALAAAGFATHLWFVGGPDLPGHEARHQLQLHRWCQWLSRAHPAGVYDGEDAKQEDYAASLPPFLLREVLLPHLQQGGTAVILAEEWHTVHAVLHLDWLLCQAQVRSQVTILWNANNTFAFHRIAWDRLAEAAMITTVSRYMKHLMHGYGVNALVIPNGLSPDDLVPPAPAAVRAFRGRVPGRTVLSKVARWDPDKGWVQTMETVSAMQRLGWHPLLLARGGIEAHGAEVLATAAAHGLRVVERVLPTPGVPGVLRLLERVRDVDIVNIRSALDPDSRRVLLRASDAVLANSRHEPFGLVGLETMAVGGIACTGCSGEDYAVPGRNALVLETTDPHEFLELFGELRANPALARGIRRAGRLTAQHYRWPEIVARILLPRLRFVATRTSADHGSPPEPLAPLESLGVEATSQRKSKGLSGSRAPPRAAL